MVATKRYSTRLVVSSFVGVVLTFAIINWQVNSFGNDRTETLPCYSDNQKTKIKIDWTKINVNILTPKQIVDYFYWTNSESCKLAHDFGGKMLQNPSGYDGQKSICLDPLVRPESGNCLVYSFGINNEWSFDESMEKYGCQVFAFDPSMGKENHDHSENIHFYNVGLGESDYTSSKGWKIKSLDSIYKMLTQSGHHKDKVIDYLKIDIESAEWKVLPQIMKSGMMKKVRQLGVEFHLGHYIGDLDYYRQLAGIIKSMEKSGMVRFDSKYNPWWTGKIPSLDNYDGSNGFEIAFYQIIARD